MPKGSQPEPRVYALTSAQVLDELIRRQGFTAQRAMPLAGFSHATFSRALNGASSLRVDEVDRLCAAIGVDPMDVWVEVERRLTSHQQDELANRRAQRGMSDPTPSLGAVADSNVGADEEVEGRQEEP